MTETNESFVSINIECEENESTHLIEPKPQQNYITKFYKAILNFWGKWILGISPQTNLNPQLMEFP